MTFQQHHIVTNTTINVDGASYTMTRNEWQKIKDLIANRKQEQAMHCWTDQFGVPFVQSVRAINRIQIVLQYGTDEQKTGMIHDNS